MYLDVKIRIDNELMDGINTKDARAVRERMIELLEIEERDDIFLIGGTDANYNVNVVGIEDIESALDNHYDEDMKEYFEDEGNFDNLCNRLRFKIDWENEEHLHSAMESIYDMWTK